MNDTALHQLQTKLPVGEVWLITDPATLQHLTGLRTLVASEREGVLVVSPQTARLCISSFTPYTPPLDQLVINTTYRSNQLTACLDGIDLGVLRYQPHNLTVNELHQLESTSWQLSTLDPKLLWQSRVIKSKPELVNLRRANTITLQVVKSLPQQLEVGQTELEVAQLIKQQMIALGADGEAFPTIVAFSEHSALPHHQPTKRALKPQQAVLIDLGAKVNGYCGDLTRSWWFGDTPTKEYQSIQDLVHQAFTEGLQVLQKRQKVVTAAQVDKVVRKVITEAGFDSAFIHTSGHGLGLEVHEPPSLNGRNDQPLEPGMVITLEPGVYLQGEFGYRYEETLLVKPEGVEVLGR